MTKGASVAKQPLPELKPTVAGDRIYRLLGNVVRVVCRATISLSVEGKEKLPQDSGYIVVSNHLSLLDPITVAYPVFVSGTLPRFLAKESLFRAPVLGWLLQKLAHIPVARGTVDARKSLETAQNVVKADGAVIIFPEGTLTKDPDGWPMTGRTGAARLALNTGAPVFPIAHWGEQEVISPSGKLKLWPRRKVKVRVGDALDFSHIVVAEPGKKYTRDELVTLTEFMVENVTGLLEDIRGDKAPEGRFNPATGQRDQKG